MKKLRQAGFTAVEGIVIVVIVAALAFVGYWVMSRQPDSTKDVDTSASEDVEAPAVDNTDDLDTAEQALDESDLDEGTTDNAELDSEAANF
jgi:hypothetical protein